jgi:hypothetical protein
MTTLERNVAEKARSAGDLRWFRAYLTGLLDGEVTKGVLELAMRSAYESLRDAGNDGAADLMLDGLDFVTGWCGPGMAIADTG